MSLKTRIKRIEAGVRPSTGAEAARLIQDRAWLKLVEALEPLVEPIIGPRGDTAPVQYWLSLPEDIKAIVRKMLRGYVDRLKTTTSN